MLYGDSHMRIWVKQTYKGQGSWVPDHTPHCVCARGYSTISEHECAVNVSFPAFPPACPCMITTPRRQAWHLLVSACLSESAACLCLPYIASPHNHLIFYIQQHSWPSHCIVNYAQASCWLCAIIQGLCRWFKWAGNCVVYVTVLCL